MKSLARDSFIEIEKERREKRDFSEKEGFFGKIGL